MKIPDFECSIFGGIYVFFFFSSHVLQILKFQMLLAKMVRGILVRHPLQNLKSYNYEFSKLKKKVLFDRENLPKFREFMLEEFQDLNGFIPKFLK